MLEFSHILSWHGICFRIMVTIDMEVSYGEDESIDYQ